MSMSLEELRDLATAIKAEVGKAIIGQDEMIDQLLVAMVSEGHVLLEGPPGTAKTFLALSFSTALGQAALLEAMQERRVTLDGETHALSERFMVVATQNPIENQGVYPLPEAQLDRFLFKLLVPYPDEAQEAAIVARFGQRQGPPRPAELGVNAVASPSKLAKASGALEHVTVAQEIVDYVVRLIRATREHGELSVGASPRAAVLLANAARARAALQGRAYAIPDDVKALAIPVLRHRLTLSPAAEIEGRDIEDLVSELVESTEAPR